MIYALPEMRPIRAHANKTCAIFLNSELEPVERANPAFPQFPDALIAYADLIFGNITRSDTFADTSG
jgi:hypothetical protein